MFDLLDPQACSFQLLIGAVFQSYLAHFRIAIGGPCGSCPNPYNGCTEYLFEHKTWWSALIL